MAQVIVRNLDDNTIAVLKAKAVMHGNSLEQELREILAEAAKPASAERLALADRIRAMTPRGRQSDSTALVRADRER